MRYNLTPHVPNLEPYTFLLTPRVHTYSQPIFMSIILIYHIITIHHHMFMCISQINTYSIYPLHTISITIS